MNLLMMGVVSLYKSYVVSLFSPVFLVKTAWRVYRSHSNGDLLCYSQSILYSVSSVGLTLHNVVDDFFYKDPISDYIQTLDFVFERLQAHEDTFVLGDDCL